MLVDITQVILILISFQSLVFILFLLTDKGPKKLSNRLLAAFLFLLGLQMAIIMLVPWLEDPGFMESWGCIFGFNYGPIIFFYTSSLIYRDFKFKAQFLLHFMPTILLTGGAISGYPMCGKFGWMIYLFLITYVAISVRNIFQYQKVVQQTQSATAAINLQWLQWTIIIFSLILLGDILDQYVFSMDLYPGVSLVHLGLLFLVNGMFFKGIRQPQIFLGIRKEDQSFLVKEETPTEKKLDEKSNEQLQILLTHLDKEKPYLNPELTLKELAEAIDIPPRQLSQLVNQHLGQNFMSPINSKRIELAMQLLMHPKDPKVTILEVMYDVGFNSKSSFNTLFKKKTGMTPSAFKRKHWNNL